MLSQKSIQKFANIYKRTFGENLSDAETLEKATSLLNAFLAVYGTPLEYTSARATDAADDSNKNM